MGDAKLMELAERCEAASGPDRELDLAIIKATYPGAELLPSSTSNSDLFKFAGGHFRLSDFRYSASLDAATSLVPKGMLWVVGLAVDRSAVASVDLDHQQTAATPALALCAAALRARASKGQEE